MINGWKGHLRSKKSSETRSWIIDELGRSNAQKSTSIIITQTATFVSSSLGVVQTLLDHTYIRTLLRYFLLAYLYYTVTRKCFPSFRWSFDRLFIQGTPSPAYKMKCLMLKSKVINEFLHEGDIFHFRCIYVIFQNWTNFEYETCNVDERQLKCLNTRYAHFFFAFQLFVYSIFLRYSFPKASSS